MNRFPTTRWSLILNAGHGSVVKARIALEQLCRTYWFPLYAYARAQGDARPDAEDLVQGFFAELLEKNLAAKADREKGRFRSFLLRSFKHHRSAQGQKLAALKRGGGVEIVSWEELGAEERFAEVLQDGMTPERRFEREWAVSILDEAYHRIGEDYAAAGKQHVFTRLRSFLQPDGEEKAYATLAADLGKTEAAIKMEVSRMRAQYGRLLREVVAQTVSDPAEVDDELRYVLTVLSD